LAVGDTTSVNPIAEAMSRSFDAGTGVISALTNADTNSPAVNEAIAAIQADRDAATQAAMGTALGVNPMTGMSNPAGMRRNGLMPTEEEEALAEENPYALYTPPVRPLHGQQYT